MFQTKITIKIIWILVWYQFNEFKYKQVKKYSRSSPTMNTYFLF